MTESVQNDLLTACHTGLSMAAPSISNGWVKELSLWLVHDLEQFATSSSPVTAKAVATRAQTLRMAAWGVTRWHQPELLASDPRSVMAAECVFQLAWAAQQLAAPEVNAANLPEVTAVINGANHRLTSSPL